MADTQTPSVAEGEQPTVTEGAPQVNVETDAAAAVTVTPMTPTAATVVPEASDHNFRVVATQVAEMKAAMEFLKHELEKAKLKSDSLEEKVKMLTTKDDAKNKEDKDGVRPLKQLDRKDVDKPDKYNGNTDQWLKWSKHFKKFLRRHDERWTKLLELIENNRGKPVTIELEEEWTKDAGIGDYMKDFKSQLNEYMETYTSGPAKVLVEACGDRKSLDAWRQLADKGHSMRAAHVHALRKKAFFPKTNVPTKDLENAISNWEADVELFETATGEKLPDPNKEMSLVDMCVESLRKHLKSLEHIKKMLYEDLKVEIADWIAENETAKHPALKNLNDPSDEPEYGEGDWGFTIEDAEAATSHAELLALVKNKFTKKGKGKGGDGPKPKPPGDHGGKVCYDCGEPGHIGADCPVRKARVAAGGPERLPREPKGKGKSGNGKNWQPNKAVWKSWFPGPTQTQWNNWFPQKGDGKGAGGRADAFHGPAHQLKSMAPSGDGAAWLFQPGYCFSLTEKKTVKPETTAPTIPEKMKEVTTLQIPEKKRSFAHDNTFEALQDEPEVDVKLPDLIEDLDEDGKPVPMVPIPKNRSPCACCPHTILKAARRRDPQARLRAFEKVKDVPDVVAYGVEHAEQRKENGPQDDKMSKGVSGAMGVPTEETYPVETPVSSPSEQPKARETSRKGTLSNRSACTATSSKVVSMMDQHFPKIEEWSTATSRRTKRMLKSTPWTPRPMLAPLIEKRPQCLNPLQSGAWEYFEAILDSGATVTVIPPSLAKEYEILEGEAAKAGVKYEIANGEEIPNLGEKLMPIMTSEGTTRGLRAQVADVSKPLQAVRSLVRSGHVVVFGDGEDGNANYIMNKLTGEVNMVKDDGTNYLLGMYVIPKAEMHAAGFTRPVPQP